MFAINLRGGVFTLPIIVKAKNNQNPTDVIRQFKKVVAATDIVQKTKDRRYFVKPSQLMAIKKEEKKKQKKRHRSQKRMKNQPVRKVSTLKSGYKSSGY